MPVAVCAAALSAVFAQQVGVDPRPPNAPNQKPAFAGQTRAPEQKSGVAFDVVTVAEGLQNPWAIEFLPDGRMLVTERPGRWTGCVLMSVAYAGSAPWPRTCCAIAVLSSPARSARPRATPARSAALRFWLTFHLPASASISISMPTMARRVVSM